MGAPFLNAFVVFEIGFVLKMCGAKRWLYVRVRAWRALAVFLTAEMTALQKGAINALLFLFVFAWWARLGAPFLNAFVVFGIGFVPKMRYHRTLPSRIALLARCCANLCFSGHQKYHAEICIYKTNAKVTNTSIRGSLRRSVWRSLPVFRQPLPLDVLMTLRLGLWRGASSLS